MKRLNRTLVLAIFASLALLPTANAQTQSASVTGTLTDSSAAAIVGAKVQLINDLTKQASEFITDSGGRYQFHVQPGDYTFHVAQNGFKALDQKINVASDERLDMHEVKLTVGDVATSVQVEGAIAHVQTDSSDKTITVNQTQIEDTPSAGRNYLNILRSLPGTFTTNSSDGRGGTGASGGGGATTVNGGGGTFLVMLNGIASQDSGAPQNTGGYQAPSIDAIGEVQVMVSNYTAEYGSRNGGQMNVVIKNGTNQFHGTAYYYWRHEELNANNWFNNKNTVTVNGIPGQAAAKPLYRYQNPGGTVGGPLYIPHKFNRDRNKLFFFFSEDDLYHKGTNGPNQYTMPTALERHGDFSQTVTTAGVLIPIYNPLAGTTSSPVQFTNNMIPFSQQSNLGYAILNLFPLPNGLDPTGARQYNYSNAFRTSAPEQDRILRIDAPLGKKTSFYVSALQDYYATINQGSLFSASGAGWGQFASTYAVPNESISTNLVHTFRPNLINELTAGINRARQHSVVGDTSDCTSSSLSALATTGANLPYACTLLTNPNFLGLDGKSAIPLLPKLFPGGNTLNALPNISWGTGGGFSTQSGGQGVTKAPGFGLDGRWPFTGTDQLTSVTDTVTWIKGTHTVKGGIYIERDSRNVTVFANNSPNGTMWFGSDRSNANDTNYPYANADIGSLFAYAQDNKRQINHSRYTTIELFVQDTWKVSRRLTLDLGLRVQSIGPVTSPGATLDFFKTSLYDRSKAGQLLFPYCTIATPAGGCPKANLASINPVTQKQYPFALVNTFDPASYASGSFPWSGAQSYNDSFWKRGTPNFGPRIGFAYDLFGDGKTAIRGGFGIFYGRATSTDQIAAPNGGTSGPQETAPQFLSPGYVYPTFNSLQGVSASYTAQTVFGGTQDILSPQTIQWSFGTQRDLGKGTIVDVSYLGWASHHGYSETGYDLNSIAPYTTWKPTPGPGTNSCGQVIAYLDPTAAAVNPATCAGGAFLNSNLIRGMVGYEGWSAIQVNTNSGAANYNSLQVQVNKRFGRRLQFSTNYTFAKGMSYSRSQDLPDKLTRDISGNHPHVINANFGYRVQNGTGLLPSAWKNYATKLVLDGWNLNGVAEISDGTWQNITCNVQSQPIGYWYGTPVNAPSATNPYRCQVTGSIWLPAGATPASVGSTSDPRLWFPFNGGPTVNQASSAFQLPGPNSFGVGNAQPSQFLGPGFFNADLSLYKEITLGKETRVLQFRVEAFNTFNHFNPGNPGETLTYNFATGAQTGNSTFGQVTATQNNSRRLAVSLRFKF